MLISWRGGYSQDLDLVAWWVHSQEQEKEEGQVMYDITCPSFFSHIRPSRAWMCGGDQASPAATLSAYCLASSCWMVEGTGVYFSNSMEN